MNQFTIDAEPVTSSHLRAVARRLPTGVTVVTSGRGREIHGTTVNSFATLSLAPPLVSFAVKRRARIRALIRASGGFVVNILAAEQAALARWFANPDRPVGAEGFAAVETSEVPATSGIRLADTVGYFDCATFELLDAGDHTIVIGSVMACGAVNRAGQLLFVDGELRSLPERLGE